MDAVRVIVETLAALCRPRICAFASLSAAVGFILARGRIEAPLIALAAAVFFAAAGASALNQAQERDVDARMARTCRRPLPGGAVGAPAVLLFAAATIGAGLAGLLLFFGATAALLCAAAAAWYNGVYTPLKKRSGFAAAAGFVTGALPPLIGWVSGGGDAGQPHIHAVMFFFSLWQIPHFWLHALHHRRDYEDAGLPSITAIFPPPALARIVAVWLAATASTTLLIALFFRHLSLAPACLAASGAWFAAALLVAAARGSAEPLRLFRTLNLYALLVMLSLSADGIAITLGGR